MIDPKMLELSVYEGIPHLLAPVVTEPKKAVVALKWTVREMEERYGGCRSSACVISTVIIAPAEAKAKGENLTRTVQTGFDKETGKAIYEDQKLDLEPLPDIVIIVDEMADLMMVAGKEIESAVQRLAQMARAAGLHVIMATQRPSVDVITGTIKANSQPVSAFRSPPKSTAAPLSANRAPSNCSGRAICCIWPAADASAACTVLSSPTMRWKVVRNLKSQGQPEYLEEVTADEPTDEDGAEFDPPAWAATPATSFLAGSGYRHARPQGLDQLHPAPAADRI